MRAWHLALACAAVAFPAVLGAAPPAGRDPEILKRTGKWVVRFDKDSCHLLGTFGEGDKAVVMRITNNAPGDWFQLSVFSNRLRLPGTRAKASIAFGRQPATNEEAMLVMNGKLPGALFRGIRIDGWQYREGSAPPAITPADEAAATSVTIDLYGKPPFRLDTGPLDKPFAVIRTCIDDLVASWGYDPAVQARLSRRATPVTPPARWLTSDDYPMVALINGHNGLVQFRLAIDAEGKVEGCHILQATEPDDFAKVTCDALTRRARLQPALDGTGKPVRSFFVSQVTWQAGEG